MKKYLPIALYAGDSEQDGTQSGVETKRRMRTAVNFIKRHSAFCIFLGAGIRPDKPNYPQFKEVMMTELQKELPTFPVFTTRKDGWGTFKETLALYDHMGLCMANEIYVCSSWYHIPRILFIWWIIAPRIKVNVIAAPSPRLSSIPMEILSFGKVFYSWYKWKHPN